MSDAVAVQLSEKVPLQARIGFGVGDFGFLLIWQGTALFLMYFYTDVLGLAPVVAGIIYLTAMIWDGVTDPIIATMADRTRSRWGRYRPWILFGAAPFALSYPLAFSTSPVPNLPVWLWALFTHILLRTTYTVVSMPFNSLQARLTRDAKERSVLAGFRMVGAASGGLTIVILTPVIVGQFGAEREVEAYFIVACIAAVLAFLGLMYCFLSMREPTDDAGTETTQSFTSELASVIPLFLRNPPLIRVFGIIVIGSICLGMFGKNVLYHFKYDLERPDLILPALVLPAAMLIFTVPAWVKLSIATSKRSTLVVGMSLALLGYFAFFFYPAGNVALAFGSILLIGIGGAALPVMFWAMVPDTVEYGEAKTGIRAEAKTFGFATFAQKAAVGINAILLGFLLQWSGFEANVDQSKDTLLAMKAMMALIPAFGVVIILWILRGYTLDQERHAELLAEIDANMLD